MADKNRSDLALHGGIHGFLALQQVIIVAPAHQRAYFGPYTAYLTRGDFGQSPFEAIGNALLLGLAIVVARSSSGPIHQQGVDGQHGRARWSQVTGGQSTHTGVSRGTISTKTEGEISRSTVAEVEILIHSSEYLLEL